MSNPLIMIVEDEKEVANEIADTIKSGKKYDTIIANSAKAAFDLLKKNKRMLGVMPNKIRCILLDIKMPEMDGLQFLEIMRKEYKEKLPVIMVTAYEDAEKWDKATNEFVAGYIKKPFKSADILGKLDRLFSKEGGQEEMIADTIVESFDKVEGKDKD